MALSEAAANIAASYRFQLRLRGTLLWRLGYASLYWGAYLYARWFKKDHDPVQANVFALMSLGQSGRTAREVFVRLPGGLSLTLDSLTCFFVLKEIFGDRIYELDERFAPREGEVVYDVGAQQGVYTTLAASRVGPKGRVVCFEPEPVNLGYLSRNIAENGLENVAVVDAALSEKAGTAKLYQSESNTGGHSLIDLGPEADFVEVRVSTLDAIIKERGLPDPALVKLDVEGSALAILRGGLETFRRAKPRLAMELDALRDADAVAKLLSPLGYATRARGNNLFAWPK